MTLFIPKNLMWKITDRFKTWKFPLAQNITLETEIHTAVRPRTTELLILISDFKLKYQLK